MKELKPKEFIKYEAEYFARFEEYLAKRKEIIRSKKTKNLSDNEISKELDELKKSYSGNNDPIQDSNCFCYITKELEQLYLDSGIEISNNFKALLEDSIKFSGQSVKMKAGLEGILLGTAASLDDYYYVIQKSNGEVIFDTGCDGIETSGGSL